MNLMQSSWSIFIKQIEEETFPDLLKLEAGQYLEDVGGKLMDIKNRQMKRNTEPTRQQEQEERRDRGGLQNRSKKDLSQAIKKIHEK